MSATARRIWNGLFLLGMGTIFIVLALFALMATAPRVHAQQQVLPVNLLSLTTRTAASVITADQTNCCWHGIYIIINTTAFTAGTYTPSIMGKDPLTGAYYTILTGAAISGTGVVVLKVLPGIVAATNVAVQDALPRTWRLQFAGSSANMTLGAGAFLIP